MQMKLAAFCAAVVLSSCGSTRSAHFAAPANPMTPEAIQSYLTPSATPSSLQIVPPPPASGSAALARDEEVSRSALAMHGTSRWELATHDAVLTFPAVAQTFSCALGVPVSETQTPQLIALLRKTLVDAGRATGEAKQHYRRPRPFTENNQPICTPEREAGLRRDGSYPSGHSSIGWTFGLVLAEVAPDRATELVARGRAFGQSRLVCNVHWQSDVEEGRIVGSAVFARLNAEPKFLHDVAAARAEVAALRGSDATPSATCAEEAQVLKSWE